VADVDAVVVGGGPAGSTAAGFLAQAGLRVILFERDRFPRYHIGESLLSATLPILDALGVLPAIEQTGFVRKPGGTFQWGRTAEPWSFFFREDPGGRPYAFHVLRSEFDHILLRHAAALGVEVREGHRVREVSRNGASRVVVRDAAGQRLEIDAAYVIDASGQQALLGRRDRLREFNPFFKNLAVFGYFEGAEPLAGPVAGNILSAAFSDGWFWFIPLHDGTTSVGAVVDAQRFAGAAAQSPEALYRRLLQACVPVAARLRHAELVSPVRIIRDYSYCSCRFYGPGYLLAGDAACFIDPVFSTGVHLACLAGFLAARAVTAIVAGAPEESEQAGYDRAYRAAFERYLEFLYFFYDHHSDPESYFWTARKVLNPAVPLEARTAFVRLMSGGGDLLGDGGSLQRELETRHARMGEATARGRFAAAPGVEMFRVRETLATMRDARGPEAASTIEVSPLPADQQPVKQGAEAAPPAPASSEAHTSAGADRTQRG
jgi:halogenation protein CepH